MAFERRELVIDVAIKPVEDLRRVDNDLLGSRVVDAIRQFLEEGHVLKGARLWTSSGAEANLSIASASTRSSAVVSSFSELTEPVAASRCSASVVALLSLALGGATGFWVRIDA
jgi:hypothetical protein